MRVIPAAHRLQIPRPRFVAFLTLLADAWSDPHETGSYRLALVMGEIDLDFRCHGTIHRRLCGRRV